MHVSERLLRAGVYWLAVVKQMVGEVIPTRVQLTFSQCQNFISDISAERNYTYHFWGHADVALQASSPKQSFAEEVTFRCPLFCKGRETLTRSCATSC